MFSLQRVFLFPLINWGKIKQQIVERRNFLNELFFKNIVFIKSVSVNCKTHLAGEIPSKILVK